MNSEKIIVAITGASGAAYALRLVEVLAACGREIHLIVSRSAVHVLETELGVRPEVWTPDAEGMVTVAPGGRVKWHDRDDFTAAPASGSFRTAGMVICPCSMATLGHVATGAGTNLIHRAADVHLKEGRRLILVPRETPLSLIHLKNMTRVAQAGGVILPACPAFYHGVETVADLVDFVVSRICDRLGVENTLVRRWEGPTEHHRIIS